ncbi:MAG: hypothetical protein HKO57_11925, partial [Akkermansiaceae bacterium]|nr:hypothetical protein [Akkermansiaceae bacterium]
MVGLALGIAGAVTLVVALGMLAGEIVQGSRVAGANPRLSEPRPFIVTEKPEATPAKGGSPPAAHGAPGTTPPKPEVAATPKAPAPTPAPRPAPAPTPAPADPPAGATVASAKLGEETYNIFCIACHQPEGKGKVGFAPYIRNSDFLALASDEFLRQSIVQG